MVKGKGKSPDAMVSLADGVSKLQGALAHVTCPHCEGVLTMCLNLSVSEVAPAAEQSEDEESSSADESTQGEKGEGKGGKTVGGKGVGGKAKFSQRHVPPVPPVPGGRSATAMSARSRSPRLIRNSTARTRQRQSMLRGESWEKLFCIISEKELGQEAQGYEQVLTDQKCVNCKIAVQKRELKAHSLLCAECYKHVDAEREVVLHDLYLNGSGQMCTAQCPHTGRPCWKATRQKETFCRSSDCMRFGRMKS